MSILSEATADDKFSIFLIIFFKGRKDYGNVERKHAFITKVIFYTTLYAASILLVSAAMIPISTVIFGHPSPDGWILPLEFQ